MIMLGALVLLVASTALAFAPPATTFQGRLTDPGGGYISDGTYNVTFRIYTQSGGGAPIWSSARQVTTAGGVFSVILGLNNPLNLPFDQLYWVGVQYEAEPEMAPRVPLTATPYALGVSENAAVTSLNGLTGDFSLIGGSNVNIAPSGGNLVISATGAGADSDWTVIGVNMYAAVSGNVGIGTSSPASKLHVVGDIVAGDDPTESYLRAHNGFGYSSFFGGDYSGQGGEFAMAQEDGSNYMFMQPDFDGDGGFFQIYDGNFGTAFQVDGNAGVDGRGVISGYGNSSFVVNLNELGNDAVSLPVDAVSAIEIQDEPGLASRIDHAFSSFALSSAQSVVTSRSITVPTDGYLLVTSSMEMELNHQGSSCYVTAGLSLTAGLPSNQDLSYYLPSTAGQGLYLNPTSPSAVFEVTAGTHTVNVVGQVSGSTDAVIWDAQLNIVFIPTAYGTVALASDADDGRQFDTDRNSPAMTAGDMAEERRLSIQDNDDRLARELADLRAQLEDLRADMNAQQLNGGQ